MMFDGVAGTRLLQLLSGTSLGEFLVQSASEEVQDVIGVFTSLNVWWDNALSMYLRDEMVGTGNCLQTLEGGMSQSRFHPELRRYVVDHASVDWETYRWTAGAFVMLKPNERGVG